MYLQMKLQFDQSKNSSRSNELTTLDLFCGAGGLTEGFRQAGFSCLYGNDQMPEALETFSYNHPTALADPRPIQTIAPREIRDLLDLGVGELDVLIGGPPCQGFSINAPERFLDDPRNRLFRDFVKFVSEFSPRAFVFENVPGLLSLGDGRIFRQILLEFERLGYHVESKILFAAHYGVPQERWRLILIGSRTGAIIHPPPTHYAVRRANFRGGRDMIFTIDDKDHDFLKPHTTVDDAIGDLPRLEMGTGREIVHYDRPANSAYAQEMRSQEGITFNHFAAKLSKQNYERMLKVPEGGSWRDIPIEILPKGMQRARRSDHTKRYGRLRRDGLSGTILTKCDPHWSSVILPDQDRTLTVREAARLQSFPDTYRFLGSRVSQYVQVGNAVPPILAFAIGQQIRQHFEGKLENYETEEIATAA